MSSSKYQPVLLEYMVFRKVACWDPYSNSLFTTSLHSIISKYPGLRCYFYADHTQIYLSFSPELAAAFSSIKSCIKNAFS